MQAGTLFFYVGHSTYMKYLIAYYKQDGYVFYIKGLHRII
jgi:hypothetical protein